MQRNHATSAYTNVPVGAGGTANYPAGYNVGTEYQKPGYGQEYVANDVKPNYSNGGAYVANDVKPNYSNGGAYVQRGQTPVSYGPDGQPIVKKNHRMRNAILGTLAVCCCCIAL